MGSTLVVIDMLNPYEHDDAERLMDSVRRALPSLIELIDVAGDHDVHLVYVNDNYGDWSAGRAEISSVR